MTHDTLGTWLDVHVAWLRRPSQYSFFIAPLAWKTHFIDFVRPGLASVA